MSLVAGQCTVDPVTGLAGRAFNKLAANVNAGMEPEAFVQGTPQRNSLAAFLEAIAESTVEEMVANATLTIPNNASGDGMQLSQAAGSPTTHPTFTFTITGAIT